MQFTTAALSAFALAGTSMAQTYTQSAPFNLFVTSESGDKTYDNTGLAACHTGAAIESLCVSDDVKSVFNLNTTTNDVQSSVPGDSVPGILTWYLDASPTGESEAMGFFIQESTNVAELLFGDGTETSVSFDENDEMNVQTQYDDTVVPPKVTANGTALYRWQMCQTNFLGYDYVTLSWILGNGKPQNPSCEPVSVKRVFTQ